jgi:hypothetical protein
MNPDFSETESEMREYRPQRSAILTFGSFFLLCLGMSAFVLVALLTMQQRADLQAQLWLYLPILLLLVAGSGAFAWFLLSALATYRIDSRGITRIVLGRQKQLLWQDVIDFQSGRLGQYGATWTLTDNGGRKLKVHTCLMERGYGLEGFLHAYVGAVREQKRAQLHLAPQIFRYGKAQAMLMLVCGVTFLCFLAGGFAASVAQPGSVPPALLSMVVVVFGGFAVLALGTAAYYFSYTVRLTPETITESSLFSTKTVPLHEIAAFYSGEMPMQNGQMQQITEVVGKNGKKIKVNAHLINYDTLTATLRSLLDAPVLVQGQQEKVVVARSSRRRQAQITMIVGPLLLLLIVGVSLPLGQSSLVGLQRQNQLDSEGRANQGTITGKWARSEGKSSTGYYLNFEFDVAGQTYRKSSPVTWDTYRNAAQGYATGVIYVPSDPNISRMTASIGKHKAIGELVRLSIYIVLGILGGIAMFFRGWKTLRAEDNTEGTTR